MIIKIIYSILLAVVMLSGSLFANGKEYCSGKNYFAYSKGGEFHIVSVKEGKELLSKIKVTPLGVYRPFMLKCNDRSLLAWTGQYRAQKSGGKEFIYSQYNIDISNALKPSVKNKKSLSEEEFKKLGVPGGFAYFFDYCKVLLDAYSKAKKAKNSHEFKVNSSSKKFTYAVRIDSKIIMKSDNRLKKKNRFLVKVLTEKLPKGYDKCAQKAYIVKKSLSKSSVVSEKLIGEAYSTLVKNNPYVGF